MTCGTSNPFARSVQTAYNNASQTFDTSGGTVVILGTQVCDTGCSIDTTNGFTIKLEGIYRLSYVLFEASGSGTATIHLYNGSTPLPCSYSQFVAESGGNYPMHVETTLPLRSCYGNMPSITCIISGAAGNVTHVCASAVRIA